MSRQQDYGENRDGYCVPVEQAYISEHTEVGEKRHREIAVCIQWNSTPHVARRRTEKDGKKQIRYGEYKIPKSLPKTIIDMSTDFDRNTAKDETPYPNGNLLSIQGSGASWSTRTFAQVSRMDCNPLYLEIDNGKRIPQTVTVLSGRNNGSRHFYFATPSDLAVKSRRKFLPGVDFKVHHQYVVAPGSRHIAGGYYHFLEQCHPEEQVVAEIPTFLLEEITATRGRFASGRELRKQLTSHTICDLPTPGPLRSDAVVVGALRHDPVAGPLYKGTLRFPQDLSRNDIALAGKLAFYSCHNFEQAMRLFFSSGLFRDKFLRPVNAEWDYAG